MGCVKVAGISVGAGIRALIPVLLTGDSSGAGCGIGFSCERDPDDSLGSQFGLFGGLFLGECPRAIDH